MFENPTVDRPSQMNTRSVCFRARGMHCHGCEHIIEISVRQLRGVHSVKADYPTETVVVVFDPAILKPEDICAAIAQKGYRCVLPEDVEAKRKTFQKLAGLVVGVVGIGLIILIDTEWISQSGAPDVSQHLSLGLIFVLGLLTGFHCIGMCGGFVLSYTADDARLGKRSYLSHVLYGAGKTLSYTVIGAMFGMLGAVVAFTPLLRGAAGVIAGIFLIIFGLNILGVATPLRKIWLRMPTWLGRFIGRQTQAHPHPFVIGLLNGLMIACGPLQAMYVMAAGTGSAREGAKMLFAFGVGTLPVLLSFGVLTTLISGALTHQLLRASGAILITLGAVMINRGLILTGSGYDLRSIVDSLSKADKLAPQSSPVGNPLAVTITENDRSTFKPAVKEAPSAVQTIMMDVIRTGYSPSSFTLRKGVAVKWIINGRQVTECNKRIVVPKLGLDIDVKKGEQVVQFTPTEEGVIPWSCWMGMLRGQFVVVSEPPPSMQSPTIVAHEPARPPSLEASPLKRAETYTIVAGDTLRGVAARLYRDERQWRGIVNANPGLDPRRLCIGQAIRLPAPVPPQ